MYFRPRVRPPQGREFGPLEEFSVHFRRRNAGRGLQRPVRPAGLARRPRPPERVRSLPGIRLPGFQLLQPLGQPNDPQHRARPRDLDPEDGEGRPAPNGPDLRPDETRRQSRIAQHQLGLQVSAVPKGIPAESRRHPQQNVQFQADQDFQRGFVLFAAFRRRFEELYFEVEDGFGLVEEVLVGVDVVLGVDEVIQQRN